MGEKSAICPGGKNNKKKKPGSAATMETCIGHPVPAEIANDEMVNYAENGAEGGLSLRVRWKRETEDP